jgi:hypothetical protein
MYILGFNCDEFGYFDISIQVFVAFGLWVSIESFDFTIFFLFFIISGVSSLYLRLHVVCYCSLVMNLGFLMSAFKFCSFWFLNFS